MDRAKYRPRLWPPLAAAAAALTLAAGLATPALASTVNTTYDRPSITGAPGGGYYIAWAGTDANGKVNGAMVNSAGTINSDTKWTDTASSTYPGTGTAIGFDYSLDVPLVAWTDLGGTVHVALDLNSTSGLICDSTGFGSSVDTPYLTFAADGTMYLTTVSSGGVMHVTEVDNDTCVSEGKLGGLLTAGPSTTVGGNTTFNGPTLVDLSLSGTPNLWLIWAGTNSGHYINIAKFTPGNSGLGTKYVETSNATTTDMGSTTITTNGAFFTYCGTNNVVYGQYFYGTGPQAQHALGGSCAIYTSSSGYINGGVDVTYDSSLSAFLYIFPNSSNRDLTVDLYY